MHERDFAGYFPELTEDDPHRVRSEPSARELQVALYVSHGMTDDMVGDQLGISPHTVRSHLKSLRQKLNAKTRVHLIAILIRRGLI